LARDLLAKVRGSKWTPEQGSEVRTNESDVERRRRFLLTIAGGSVGAVALGGPALGASFFQQGGGPGGGGTAGRICTSTSSYTTSSSSSYTVDSAPSWSHSYTYPTTSGSSGSGNECQEYTSSSGTGYFGDGPGASSADSDHFYENGISKSQCWASEWADGTGSFSITYPSHPSYSGSKTVYKTVTDKYTYRCEEGEGAGQGGGFAFKPGQTEVSAEALDPVNDPRLAHGHDWIVRLGCEDLRIAEEMRRGQTHSVMAARK
jgi:hypothetical protein